MKLKLLLVIFGAIAVSESKRPPWYKPCWIYMCGLDVTDPVCAWDPHHGARLFRNDCEMDRHNFCYNRNYAIVDGENNVEEDTKLCERLKEIVGTAGEKPKVVEDGNVRVHFMEDPNASIRQHRQEALDRSEERRHKLRERLDSLRKRHHQHQEHYGHRKQRLQDNYDGSSSEEQHAYRRNNYY